jgi:N-acetylglucosaminyldiphosphoundecaprenol N-acetyl-beta-D-mannosaminyltransferase
MKASQSLSKTVMSSKKLTTLQLFELPIVMDSIDGFVTKILQQISTSKRSTAVMVVSMQDVLAKKFQPAVAAAFKSFDFFTPDGMPLVWLAKWLGVTTAHRIYGPDLFRAILSRTENTKLSHFFYGGTNQSVSKLQKNVISEFPHLTIAGSFAPPFRQLTVNEKKTVVQLINRLKPDIIWVGLGSWKQLLWVAEFKPLLKTKLIIPVGMAFDFWAHTKRPAPLWMQRNGLEWLYRLVTEPQRLWSRYLWQVPFFAVLLLKEWWQGSRRSIKSVQTTR